MALEVIGFILVTAIIVVLVLAFRKPDQFRVSRSATYNATPDAIFEQVNNLRKGHQWSPWVEMDPGARYIFEGQDAGEGATLHWEGKKSGKGTMAIVESRPDKLVRSSLHFLKPMDAKSTADFIIDPLGDQTKLTWAMYGPNNFMGKLMSVFINCEKMTGTQFAKGLENLRKVIEN